MSENDRVDRSLIRTKKTVVTLIDVIGEEALGLLIPGVK